MGYYFSKFSGAEAAGLSSGEVWVLNAVLIILLGICAYTDARSAKIYNVVTFPTWIAGWLLNWIFGGTNGLMWSLLGWAIGMGIQWVPFMLGFAKAGDVKLLAAVGAVKGWAFCLFGFLYGAAVFGFLLLPWLARRGELNMVGDNIRRYFATAAMTQSVPDSPVPTVTKRFVPWGVGLSLGFFIALIVEILLGRPMWF